mmetsp:Transcript_30688/g.31228  ORF Transcript_30688/g.31228 Transcript_30688/m.31228 type:complete len:277 (+) Transcript_30688:1-831(+)
MMFIAGRQTGLATNILKSSNQIEVSDFDEIPLTSANAKCSKTYQSYDKVTNAPGAYALFNIINNYRSGKRNSVGEIISPLDNSKCDEKAYNAAYWYGADLAGQFDGSPKTVPLSHIDSEGRDFATRVQAFGLDPANSAEALFYGINCIDDAFLVWKDNNNEYEGMQEMMYDERFDKAGVSITYSKAKGSLDAYFVMVYTKDAAAGTPVSVPTAAPVAAAAKTTKVKPTRRPKVKKTKKPRTKRVKKPKNKRKKNKKPKKPKVKRTKKPRNPKPTSA